MDLDPNKNCCELCRRPTPVFLSKRDENIMRLNTKYMPEFLKSLRQDFIQRCFYLNFLKVSSKLIQPCHCKEKLWHQYCGTAQVLRTQRIYCEHCNSYYRLHLQKRTIIDQDLRNKFTFLFLITVIFSIGIFGVSRLDSYLKRQALSEDERELFSEDKFVLTSLYTVFFLLILYCLFNAVAGKAAFVDRKKLLWAEVQEIHKSNVTRMQAKLTLQEIFERGDKDNMFDLNWYLRREEIYTSNISEMFAE